MGSARHEVRGSWGQVFCYIVFFFLCTSNAPVDVISPLCLSVNISDVEVVSVALEYGLRALGLLP